MFATVNYMHRHLLVKFEAGEEFGCHEKVLACPFLTCDIDHALVHHALIARIHALIDLVDDAEGRLREVLERHEVEYCRDGALAAGLAVRV